jgi:thiamine biosynthesis lipoprotein ApbE
MRLKLLGFAALVAAITTTAWLHQRSQRYGFHYDNVLGTSMEVTVIASSQADAHRASAAVLDRIDRDARILSGYDPASEFSRWFATRGEAAPVSPELYDVLGMFDTWRNRSGGALDASAETVSRVWKQAAAAGREPSSDEIDAAVAQVRRPHWRLDADTRTATHLDDAPVILNSFTKSYIVDRAATAAMSSAPIRAVVVNVGGDIVTRGNWVETIGVRDPLDDADNAAPMARVMVRDRAVATSGSYRRGFDIGARHYSHIVDPRTGRPTSHVISATVVADRAADAGALATAFCVLSPAESERLGASVPGAQFLIVLADGSRIESAGWRLLSAEPQRPLRMPSPVVSVYAAEQAGKPEHELAVNVEIAQIQAQGGARIERPYLAIWIEDKDKIPVRTLTVLYRTNEARFLADLRAWYRADRLRALTEGTEILNSVSSATRSPGKYTFKWDLKDHQGALVKPGTYTVCIEAAREHGTYQIMRQAIDLSGTDKQVTIPVNNGIEIAAASLEYHQTAAK